MKTFPIPPLRVHLSVARACRRIRRMSDDHAAQRERARRSWLELSTEQRERQGWTRPPSSEASHKAVIRRLVRAQRRYARVRIVRVRSRYYLAYGRRIDRLYPGTGGFATRRRAELWFTKDGR